MPPDELRPDELLTLRVAMDDLNQQLVALLHQRARLARRIGRLKQAAGITAIDAGREQAMLATALQATPSDGFPRTAMATILGAVFTASRTLVGDPDR